MHKLSETVSGKLICMLVVLIRVSTWLQFVVVTDLSGQMLTFDGVWHFGEVLSSRMILVFTVQGRWQTACMALCRWAVCWCQRCGSSGPWWRWDYGMLWTTNTGAFYWWHFECTEIPWWDIRHIRQRVPVPANNPATSHSHWRGVDQHSTGHNQQPDQLYAKEMCCTVWGKWWSLTPDTDWFSDTPGPPPPPIQ